MIHWSYQICRGLIAALLTLSALLAVATAQTSAPAATITSVDTKTGLVTGRVTATGEQFQFTLNNRAQLPQLRVGEGVYVNLKTKQVSLDGKTSSGTIVTIERANDTGATRTAVRPPRSQVPVAVGSNGAQPVPAFVQAAVDLLTKSRDFTMPGYPSSCMFTLLYFDCSHHPTVRLVRSSVTITKNGPSSYLFTASILGRTIHTNTVNSELGLPALTGNIAGNPDYMQIVQASISVPPLPPSSAYVCAVALNANQSAPIAVSGTLNIETANMRSKLTLASGLQVSVPAADLQLDRPDSPQCPPDFVQPVQFPIYVQTSIANALAVGWQDPMCSSNLLGALTPCSQSGTH